jgi:hypothetical protein
MASTTTADDDDGGLEGWAMALIVVASVLGGVGVGVGMWYIFRPSPAGAPDATSPVERTEPLDTTVGVEMEKEP